MSRDDVALVMYESTKMRADFYQERYERATTALLALRRRLRVNDPTLPYEYDGLAWMKYETADDERALSATGSAEAS